MYLIEIFYIKDKFIKPSILQDQLMVDYNQQIKEFEEELKNTKYNKRTQHHIGLVKAKIARLKERQGARSKSSGPKGGYHVRKSGDATVVLLGFPSCGKSTLLNALTNADSDVGAYAFTTLSVIPGLLEYNHAKIQILDMPGIVRGAADGSGRGREVLATLHSADLIIILVDVNSPKHYQVILDEIYKANVRVNQNPPDVKIRRTSKGGINVASTLKLKHLTEETIKSIMKEFRITNAEIVIREDITDDQLIDVIEKNKIYVKALTVLNKIDTVTSEKAKEISKKVNADMMISAQKGDHTEMLKETIFRELNLIRIYLKEPGKDADMKEPLIVMQGYTIGDVCNKLHRDFSSKFRFARLWGKSSKFDGQKILKKTHQLHDKDVLEIHMR